MQSAALIVQVDDAMMMVGVGSRDCSAKVVVTENGRRLVNIKRVVANECRYARDLGEREQSYQATSQPARCSNERHARLPEGRAFLKLSYPKLTYRVLRECRTTHLFLMIYAKLRQ